MKEKTKTEFQKVEGWLFAIPEDRIKLASCLRKIKQIDDEIPELSGTDYRRDKVSGGGRVESEQERWIGKIDEWRLLKKEAEKIEGRLKLFEDIMRLLENKDRTFKKLYQIKYEKLYSKWEKPTDEDLAKEIGVSIATYYRKRKALVEYFLVFNVL